MPPTSFDDPVQTAHTRSFNTLRPQRVDQQRGLQGWCPITRSGDGVQKRLLLLAGADIQAGQQNAVLCASRCFAQPFVEFGWAAQGSDACRVDGQRTKLSAVVL